MNPPPPLSPKRCALITATKDFFHGSFHFGLVMIESNQLKGVMSLKVFLKRDKSIKQGS